MKFIFVTLLISLFTLNIYANADAPEAYQVIEVKKGDTLSKISKKYLEDPSQWRALLKFNAISNPNLIQPGMQLKIPASLEKKAIARVVYKKGEVVFTRFPEEQWKDLALKLGLYVNDKVKTLASSTVHLELSNRSVLRLLSESIIVINKASPSDKDAIFSLQRGRLQANVHGLKETGSQLTLRTPTMVAAVRGTIFDVETSNQESGLACFDGLVDVSAQGVTVNVPAGMGTFVEKGKAPMTPFRLPPPPTVTPAD